MKLVVQQEDMREALAVGANPVEFALQGLYPNAEEVWAGEYLATVLDNGKRTTWWLDNRTRAFVESFRQVDMEGPFEAGLVEVNHK